MQRVILYEAKSASMGLVMLAKFYQDFVDAGLGWASMIWDERIDGPSSRDFGMN